MAWYGKFVEPAISKREATRYRAIVNQIWQISVPKEFERLIHHGDARRNLMPLYY